MAKVVVVFHSGYGHTQRLAQSVAQGAGAELLAIDADGNLPEGGWEALAAADAIVFGSPTYMGSVSWQFKKFADASSKPWFGQAWKDKLAAGFTNSASMNGNPWAISVAAVRTCPVSCPRGSMSVTRLTRASSVAHSASAAMGRD